MLDLSLMEGSENQRGAQAPTPAFNMNVGDSGEASKMQKQRLPQTKSQLI